MTDVKPPSQSPSVDRAARLHLVPPPPTETEERGETPPHGPPDFRAVYEAHFDYVFHSLRRLGVYDRDLEDLAHDVFVAFYRGLDGFDPARPIKPWLFGIAFRVASDHRRRARHRFEVQGDGTDGRAEFADAQPLADEQAAAGQERAVVRAALETLDLDRRAVFVMHDLDGHAMPEIAAALSVPLNTCYSRLRLAREQFATAVRRRMKRPRDAGPDRSDR